MNILSAWFRLCSLQTCTVYDTKLYLMVRLLFLISEECRVPLYCYYSQVHSDLESSYLLSSYLSSKFICLKIIHIPWEYLIPYKLFVFRIVTWCYNYLLRIIISFLKPYNFVKTKDYYWIEICISCRAGSTDIPDPLSPFFPIVHRLRQVFWTTSHILT